MNRIAIAFVLSLGIAPGAGAQEPTIAIDRAACDALVEHVPADDLRFVPSLTADGRDVAPADLRPRPILPERIPILITAKLRDTYGLPFESPLLQADAVLGLIVYDRLDRRLTFNGVELGDPEQRLLAAQCRAAAQKAAD
jgi:hypothetical protein